MVPTSRKSEARVASLRGAGNVAAIVIVTGLVVLAASCVKTSMARFKNATILYDGAPYGDLVVLADRVRSCMHSDKQTLPRLILVDRIFDCYTTSGWKQAYGCTGESEVVMVAPVAEQSRGQLWAHELTHYFGAPGEGDPCGTLTLAGFSLQRPDAGL
jgi:hypothetical protein